MSINKLQELENVWNDTLTEADKIAGEMLAELGDLVEVSDDDIMAFLTKLPIGVCAFMRAELRTLIIQRNRNR